MRQKKAWKNGFVNLYGDYTERISRIIKLLIPKNDKNNSFGDEFMLFNFLSWFKWLEFRGGCVKLKSTFIYNIYIFNFGRIYPSLSKLVASSSFLRAVDKKRGLLIKKSSWLFAGIKKGFTFAIQSCRVESFI